MVMHASRPRCLVSLTNIPAPYRVHFYNSLDPLLAVRGIQLKVFFMAETEPGRHWTFNRADWRFQYRFAAGLHPMLSQYILHFNPTYMWDFIVRPPTWLLVAGSWFFPTVALSVPVSKSRRTKTLFWSESNLAYLEHTGSIANKVRRWVMDSFDGFVVPGQWAEKYVRAYAPSAREKPLLTLPNVVDERKFRDAVAERRQAYPELLAKWGLAAGPRPILLTVARLEPIKGVKELIQAVCKTSLYQRLTLLVAGEGSLHTELETIITRAGANNTVRLLGHLSEVEVLDLLAIADGFILPSLGDPYPLSAIEAAFARLPLLLSDRVGCHPEVLVCGENGWLFDPTNASDIEHCLEQFLATGPLEWIAMGSASSRVAEERFATDRVLAHFVDQLVAL